MMKMSRIMWCSSRKRKKNNNYDYNYSSNEGFDEDSSRLLKQKRLKSNNGDLQNNKAVTRGFSLGRCSFGKKKQTSTIKKGDILNLSQLLFTKRRDFLITYNDRTPRIQAKDILGKVVVLHFVPLVPASDSFDLTYYTTSLVDIYNALHPRGGFEVVFVAVKVDHSFFTNLQNLLDSDLEEIFEEQFSFMPWTAIPFSDFESRDYLGTRFPISDFINVEPVSFIIDPRGKVLQCRADDIFRAYGAQSYPFTDRRIGRLVYEDERSLNYPSISNLLASPTRNYVIDNNMQAVPLRDLEDKVVALYFFEDYPLDEIDSLTIELQKVYEQFAEVENFEIVLVYIHDAFLSFKWSTEESFWKRFSKMPWLALPYNDPTCKKLQRVFNYPMDAEEGPEPDPRLVVIGPRGKFVERYGIDILKNFGTGAYPFTRTKVAELEVEYIKKLKLNMFWDLSTFFRQNDGSTVQLSQLLGKKIILVVENTLLTARPKFWRKLIARYTQMKETDDELEVIHVSGKQEPSYGKHVATMSWLRHPLNGQLKPNELLARILWQGFGLVAFDVDGRVVRRTVSPSIKRGNLKFPFYSGGLEKEVLMELKERFEWEY